MTEPTIEGAAGESQLTPAQRRLQERLTKLRQVMETETDPNVIAQAIGLKDRQGLITWCKRHGEPEIAKQFYR